METETGKQLHESTYTELLLTFSEKLRNIL